MATLFLGPIEGAMATHQCRDSIAVSIPACHAGDPGSIPGRGAFLFAHDEPNNDRILLRLSLLFHLLLLYYSYPVFVTVVSLVVSLLVFSGVFFLVSYHFLVAASDPSAVVPIVLMTNHQIRLRSWLWSSLLLAW